ncbi:increased DNA methylation 3-like [Rhodamnia argentea]|uniref:Increased DNA methylation 3-like n=1 Tax=Rhodamnia argentea TaxID=178133 RepID=A0A8B8QD51_9MYRT|nr:increased DNA methylation 3-like [Rhodamnia argentea]
MAQTVNAAAPSTAAPAGEDMMTNDQHFLLTIILGIYFGPHLKGERPPYKSAMQRVHERLPHYTSNQLAGSKMMVAQIMHVYYYILRKASQSVVVAPPLLLKFFSNTLPTKVLGTGSNYPRFNDLFPTDLHPCSYVEERFIAIDNIMFSDAPSTSYLREEVVTSFKSLTGLQEFILEKDAANLPIYVTDEAFYEVVAREEHSEGLSHFFVPPGSHSRKRMSNVALDVMPLRRVPYEGSPSSKSSRFSGECKTNFKAQLAAKVVFSPLSTAEMQCRGTVAASSAGVRLVGNVDVGLAESKDCYLFQVSLPGVRRDQKGNNEFLLNFLLDAAAFSCELDMSGEVLIEGETATDGKVVEGKAGNLCLSGHFSLCFQLPGCVDPRQSNCNFGTDGIFEGVVKKLIDY